MQTILDFRFLEAKINCYRQTERETDRQAESHICRVTPFLKYLLGHMDDIL